MNVDNTPSSGERYKAGGRRSGDTLLARFSLLTSTAHPRKFRRPLKSGFFRKLGEDLPERD